MSRYAVVCDGQVVNVCLWDGETEWTPEDDCTVHQLPDDSPVGPGWGLGSDGRWEPSSPVDSQPVQVTVDPVAIADLLAAVQDPNVDVREALTAFAAALNPSTNA